MELDDSSEEEGPVFAWLPPEDRLWRHPSEVTATPSRPPATSRAGARTWTVALVAGLVGALLASGVGVAAGSFDRHTVVEPVVTASPGTVAVDVSSPSATAATNGTGDWPAIADAVAPALVALSVTGAAGRQPLSGVLFGAGRQRCYILTSADAVDGASAVQATFDDGTTVPAHVVGADPATGIGVLWVAGRPRSLPQYGSVSQVQVADEVLAVASRNGGAPSVSSPGALSSVDDQVVTMGGTSFDGMIAVSGSSVPEDADGGALVDAAGAVIGLDTDLSSVDPAQQGVLWAVPIDAALRSARQLMAGHQPVDPWIGVEAATDLSTATAHDLGLAGGAQIGAVAPGSPAARAGLDADDIVTNVGGHPVRSSGVLESDLTALRPGQRVVVGYLEHDQPRRVSLVVGARR